MFVLLLLLLALGRILELQLAASNTAHLKARNAIEVGAGHYPVMVLLHTGWFLAMLWEWWNWRSCLGAQVVALCWAMLLFGQALRWLTISTLGRRWTTRILVLPDKATVSHGPFRWLRHPNYLGVCLEVSGVPLIGGCWRTALVFGVLNGLLLRYRVRIEEEALVRYSQAHWESRS